MLFAEEHARLLLIVHTALAVALVAASTHLVVWMRGFAAGKFQRIQAVRRFALIAAVLFVLTLVVGNLMYPVYKVRVRAEFLDQAGAVMRDYRNRLEARQDAATLYRDEGAASEELDEAEIVAAGEDLPRRAARIARWFDVKEHWVALGMAMSVGLAVLVRRWDPRREGQAVGRVAFAMAVAAALSAWLGAIIGVVVSSYRAIGGP